MCYKCRCGGSLVARQTSVAEGSDPASTTMRCAAGSLFNAVKNLRVEGGTST